MVRLPPKITPKQFEIKQFMGMNSTDAPANVKPNFSPECPNMIRETTGKVRKWIGYHTAKTYDGQINGAHFLRGVQTGRLVHAGAKLYRGDDVIYSGMNNIRSVSRQLGGKLWLFDGKKALVYGEFDGSYGVRTVESLAKIPTVLIGKTPSGGGAVLEAINLLQPRRTETFYGTETDKVYQLSVNNLDAAPVTVEKMKPDGSFETLAENTAFTVNRATGAVTFTDPPGKPPLTDVPNVKITASKTVEGYADKINLCDVITLYGVNGAQDRIFAAGNPAQPNYDYYCQMNDPTYWGDLWYSVIGQDNSPIMGYSIVNDQLATHKQRSDDDTNVVLRRGTLMDGKAAFPLSGSYQGTGAGSKYAFSVLNTEPMFATVDKRIFAVTPSDVLGERYAQERSYYLNGLLEKETGIENAVACIYDNFYLLALGSRLYALDGTQIVSEKNTPYSTRQYIAYCRENVNARLLWEEDGKLYFGTMDGKINEFYTDYGAGDSFCDNGTAIAAYWDTPEFYGSDFYAKKDFRKIAVLLGAAVATGCRIWAFYEGEKELLRDYDSSARYFSYSQFAYSKLTYKTDRTPQELIEKIKIKKVEKVRFRFENDVKGEPFALYTATAEFTERR